LRRRLTAAALTRSKMPLRRSRGFISICCENPTLTTQARPARAASALTDPHDKIEMLCDIQGLVEGDGCRVWTRTNEEPFSLEATMLGTILVVVLVLLLLGAIPTWPHSRQWGYAPSGLLGTVLLIVLILWLLGRL
jgi:Protein of unknown function (DUF3309)